MWRGAAIILVAYGYGHPHFDNYRPDVLDRPLEAFHAEFNMAARDGQRALGVLDDGRSMRYLKTVVERLDTDLRGRYAQN